MSEVLQLLNRIARETNVSTVWELAVGYFASHGFSRANYGLTRFRVAGSIGDPDDAIYLTSFPAGYSNFYFRGGFYARTALYRWAVENEGLCTWRWVEEKLMRDELTPTEISAVRQNSQWGLRAGLTFSFHDATTRAKGALGLAADQGIDHDGVDAILARVGDGIEAVAQMLHLRVCHLPHAARRRTLSARQREALEWVAEGKTTQDIAMLMGISNAMVEKHLRLARAALNVETTAQAVAKGTLLHQIFLPDVTQR
jgi:DNA-binding CsgD family transcriptional regulator